MEHEETFLSAELIECWYDPLGAVLSIWILQSTQFERPQMNYKIPTGTHSEILGCAVH